MTRHRCKSPLWQLVAGAAALNFAFGSITGTAAAGEIPLVNEQEQVSENVLEAFLAPGEFPSRRVTFRLEGDAAAYAMDLGLSAQEPLAIFHPERVALPKIAGLPLVLESQPLSLNIVSSNATDDRLDEGFTIQLTLVPLGQRFESAPRFAAKPVAVTLRANDGEALLVWTDTTPAAACRKKADSSAPACTLGGIGLEARALALSPDGDRLAIAFGGLRPRLELYTIHDTPKRLWQILLPKNSGGAVETSFSSDGRWVVVLTGQGRMHRFDARTGGRHLLIPSRGRSARAIPPGRIMAVAGESGEVKMWYLSDGTIAWHLPPRMHRGGVDRIAASGDGARFALMEYTKTQTIFRVFEFRNRSMLWQFALDTLAIADIALDDKGHYLFLSHDTDGLLLANIEKTRPPIPVQKKGIPKCTGRLVWHYIEKTLSCAAAEGVLTLSRNGKLIRRFKTPETTDKWIVSAAAEGRRIAAVGDGRLLVWRLNE